MDDKTAKKKELRRRLKSMEEARRGKTIVSDATNNMSKKDRRQMKKVVKSTHIDDLLKQFNITDQATQMCLKKSIQEGRISNMEDLAKFLSKQTHSEVTTNDLMQNDNSSHGEAAELFNIMNPNINNSPTGYENVDVSQEKRRPMMSAPFTVGKEDL